VSLKFENKVALVTGAGRGIGKEIVLKLSEIGVKVCIMARTKSQVDEVVNEITKSGRVGFGFVGDMKNSEDLYRIVEEIRTEIGTIDILVNNAGIAHGGMFLWDDDPIKWWETMEVNLKGPMILCHLILKDMISNNSGIIVNISSFAAIRSTPMASAYGVSKTAISRLTDTIAESVKEYNIGIFAISPGLVLTDMARDVPFFKDLPPDAWTPIEKSAEVVSKLVTGKYNKLSGRFIHVDYDLENMLNNVEKIVDDGLFILRLPTFEGLQE